MGRAEGDDLKKAKGQLGFIDMEILMSPGG